MENKKYNDYYNFLLGKIDIAPETGIDIDETEVSNILLPHQRDAVKWAVKGGKRALFESFGLGKTIQQLEIIRLILKHKGGKGLIVCPLGVKQEFKHDANKLLGFDVKYIKHLAEATGNQSEVYITNYERVRDGLSYCRATELNVKSPTLFDIEKFELETVN